MTFRIALENIGWLAICILLLTTPAVTFAQIKPEAQVGSRIPQKPKKLDVISTGQVRKAFAQCLYRKSPAKVQALLDHSDPVSVDYSAANFTQKNINKDLGMDDCLHVNELQIAVSMQFSDALLRSMLAEEAYLDKFDTAPVLPEGSVEGTDRVYVSTGDALKSAQSLGYFADCVVFSDTKAADAILRTQSGSRDEKAIIRQFTPVLGACLAQGSTIELNADSLRSILADGLWMRYVRTAATAPVIK